MDLTDILTVLMEAALNVEFGKGLPKSWKMGVVKVIYMDGDPANIRNYRQLSMTNSVYKLETSITYQRIIQLFEKCIGTYQSGLMPGRSYFDNIKNMQTIIDGAEQLIRPVYTTLLDQEEAYDRVEYNYLWDCLRAFNLPESLIKCIRNFYQNAASTVSINGFVSESFRVNRGVR